MVKKARNAYAYIRTHARDGHGTARERDIEAAFVREGVQRGALVYKFSSPGHAGVPDRIVVRPGGTVDFVEIKAPGERPRPLQEATFRKLAERGCPVSVIDSLEGARDWWDAR